MSLQRQSYHAGRFSCVTRYDSYLAFWLLHPSGYYLPRWYLPRWYLGTYLPHLVGFSASLPTDLPHLGGFSIIFRRSCVRGNGTKSPKYCTKDNVKGSSSTRSVIRQESRKWVQKANEKVPGRGDWLDVMISSKPRWLQDLEQPERERENR